MTDTDRCEPPPEWRGKDGCHWVEQCDGAEPVAAWWDADAQEWDHDLVRETPGWGWQHTAPVTPPATVAALVEALEDMVREQQSEAQAGTGEYQRGYDDCIAAHADTALAALALYRGEAGR